MNATALRVGLLATHPIQYYAPWYRALAREVDLEVFFSHRQTPEGQAEAGFGVTFEWDVPVLDGYRHTFLRNVARHPNVGTFWGCRTPELPGIIQERAFDAFIVHGWSTYSYWQAMVCCWRTGTPLLVRGDSILSTPRAAWWRLLKEPMFRSFIPRFDGYLVVGSRAREYVLHYGGDAAKCFDAPHSVDNAFFEGGAERLQPERSRIRHDFGLSERGPVFLFAGRFIDRKRPDWFVRAIADAAKQHVGVSGLMVGDGPLRAETEAMAGRLDAPIRFAGFLNQTEMVRAYVAADVLVVPSTWETWGLVVNEAMACGVPAIVSDGVACAHDLVIAGTTGEVFAVEELGDLIACVNRIAGDEAYRTRLSEHARRRVARWDVSVAANGTVQAIQEVILRRAGHQLTRPPVSGPVR